MSMSQSASLRTSLIALGSGLLFGVGLAVSGMFDPAKVLGFLDVAAISTGGWDPSLAFVMAGGLAVALPAFQIAQRRRQPVAAPQFHAPGANALGAQGIDGKLLLGALLFGVGWGLVGYCPGPALAALAFGATGTIAFVLAMAVGMVLHGLWPARQRTTASSTTIEE